MKTTIHAHKGVGVDCKVAGGSAIVIPAGGVLEVDLTGDQVARVEAYLAAQEAHMKMGPSQFGGKVVCPEREAPPPKGSKKYKLLHPDPEPTPTPTNKVEVKVKDKDKETKPKVEV